MVENKKDLKVVQRLMGHPIDFLSPECTGDHAYLVYIHTCMYI